MFTSSPNWKRWATISPQVTTTKTTTKRKVRRQLRYLVEYQQTRDIQLFVGEYQGSLRVLIIISYNTILTMLMHTIWTGQQDDSGFCFWQRMILLCVFYSIIICFG